MAQDIDIATSRRVDGVQLSGKAGQRSPLLLRVKRPRACDLWIATDERFEIGVIERRVDGNQIQRERYVAFVIRRFGRQIEVHRVDRVSIKFEIADIGAGRDNRCGERTDGRAFCINLPAHLNIGGLTDCGEITRNERIGGIQRPFFEVNVTL